MRKLFFAFLLLASISFLYSCMKSVHADTLVVYLPPTTDDISNATDPFKASLLKELTRHGLKFKKVDIRIGNSYDEITNALKTGSADAAYLPAGTYARIPAGGARAILAATHYGLNKDYPIAREWNDGKPTTVLPDRFVNYYRGLILSGPSLQGLMLADKVNSGKPVLWSAIRNVNWCIGPASSSAGYVYPNLWLYDTYGKSITELLKTVSVTDDTEALAKLNAGTCDVAAIEADSRLDYALNWKNNFIRPSSIWTDTSVIGVTTRIYNDTVTVTGNKSRISDSVIGAIQDSFISASNTPDGKEMLSLFKHSGYLPATDSDYTDERLARLHLDQAR